MLFSVNSVNVKWFSKLGGIFTAITATFTTRRDSSHLSALIRIMAAQYVARNFLLNNKLSSISECLTPDWKISFHPISMFPKELVNSQ